jgi:hypothetical protein
MVCWLVEANITHRSGLQHIGLLIGGIMYQIWFSATAYWVIGWLDMYQTWVWLSAGWFTGSWMYVSDIVLGCEIGLLVGGACIRIGIGFLILIYWLAGSCIRHDSGL